MKGFGEKNSSKKKINGNKELIKKELIQKAFEFHSEGKILEATKYYEYFLNQGFTDHRVFSNYGVILENIGKLKEAEQMQRKAIKINPQFASAHLNLGNILNKLQKFNEAKFSTLTSN